MFNLKGKICVVTGASRGIGKGIALALLGYGATVHISARTATDLTPKHDPGKEGSLEAVRREAAELPGELHAHVCDHGKDAETEALIAGIIARYGRIDLLVNNAWPGYEHMAENNEFTWIDPFWKQPMWRWDAMIDTGVRAAYCGSRVAAAAMVEQRSGLIASISFWAAQKFNGNTVYGVAKAAIDKMSADMAHELRPHGVAAVSIYPGLVRTEAVMQNAQYFDMSNSESPQFVGRAIAGLLADPYLMAKSGGVHVTADLALEYGFTDIDGKQPVPMTLERFS
jgi:NAD(P)-dependent dehydrogenase (short-subunit alcohol dehydrogenase family)